jgi:hypothetical protein
MNKPLAAHRLGAGLALAASLATVPVLASDHLDTPTVLADPAADIGDLYAWTSPDGRRLNLVLDIVGRRFSDQVQYVMEVDSGPSFGHTTASTRIACQFDVDGVATCWAGTQDGLHGDVASPRGLDSRKHRFRVFAGPRDDPYFNNVRGTRAALDKAAAALRSGSATRDASGFAHFDEATLKDIHEAWHQTNGGPAANFLAGWRTSAIVVSVDLPVVSAGGPLLAVWARTERRRTAPGHGAQPPEAGAPIDRVGRPLTANALLATVGDPDIADALKEGYNRADPEGWQAFATEIGRNLALYDGLDGIAGNQWLSDAGKDSPARYQRLAALLADDRLWIDSRRTTCGQYLAVERAAFGSPNTDCGGRSPSVDVNGVFRSMLIRGTPDVSDDGVDHDDHTHSSTDFPFLAAP